MMTSWTEDEVINKLNEGWALSGDMASEAPFGFINPSRQILTALPAIPANLVRRLYSNGLLTPEAQPGKKYMYRLNPHAK